MSESHYTAAIKKLLPNDIYAWKIAARFANGIPDTWYSGPENDLWVEYKLIKTAPRIIKPNLSPLQRAWLNLRYQEGRNVAVILETCNGAVILEDQAWDSELATKDTSIKLHTKREIANWIAQYCGSKEL